MWWLAACDPLGNVAGLVNLPYQKEQVNSMRTISFWSIHVDQQVSKKAVWSLAQQDRRDLFRTLLMLTLCFMGHGVGKMAFFVIHHSSTSHFRNSDEHHQHHPTHSEFLACFLPFLTHHRKINRFPENTLKSVVPSSVWNGNQAHPSSHFRAPLPSRLLWLQPFHGNGLKF